MMPKNGCRSVLQGCDTEAEVNCCFVLCYAMLNGSSVTMVCFSSLTQLCVCVNYSADWLSCLL